ncbi:3-oxoadipate enol-lactonase [Roseibium album]|nr:3-oxoadipate enol-lactonase [Roseibium album]
MPSAPHEILPGNTGNRNQSSTAFTWTAPDGLMLAGEHWAPKNDDLQIVETSIQVLCLPGLSRNTRDFHDIASFLQSAGHHVYALDYRGRGNSDWDKDWNNYSLPVEAGDIDTAIELLELERFALLGTSRGGLHALAMADRYPAERMAAVIFNDVGPRIERSAIKRIAASIGQKMKFSSLEGVAEHQRNSLGPQFPAFSEDDWYKLAEQLATCHETQTVLDYDPNLAHMFNDLDDETPLPELWPYYEKLTDRPVLVVRGEHSDLLSITTGERMLDMHSGAVMKTIPGQGHAPVLWEPETHDFIESFLKNSIS